MVVRSRARGRSRPGTRNRPPQHGSENAARNRLNIPAQDTAAQHEALAGRIIENRIHALNKALRPAGAAPDKSSGQNFKALYDFVRDSYDLCNTLQGKLELDPPLACQSGCIHCCYNQISLTEPEALFLGWYLVETRSAEELQKLEPKAIALVDLLKGKSRQDIGMERHLHHCLFLEENACTVYPARPLVCRGWNSVNREMCIQSNETGDALTPIEIHPLPKLLAESIQLGLLHGAQGLGLEAGSLVMARAMALLLDGGLEKNLLDCTSDWLQGKPFFGRRREW